MNRRRSGEIEADDSATIDDDRAGRLLIVRHGPGRGPQRKSSFARSCFATMVGSPFRRPRDLEPFLSYVAGRDPAMRRRINVWETGTPPPPLRDFRAVLFYLQDPLEARFPDCYAEARALAERAHAAGLRVINPPRALSNSIKSVQSRLWRAAGLATPEAASFTNAEEARVAAQRISFPALLRADCLHGWPLQLLNSREEFLKLPAETLPSPGCFVQFVDTRESYRERCPDSEFAKFYHKKRVWVIGDRVQASHLFFSTDPLVWARSCTFSHYKSVNVLKRIRAGRDCREHARIDYEFFRQGEPNAGVFLTAAKELGLEFVAIDYSSFADGRVVLWEANPYFTVMQWPLDLLRRQRRTDERHDALYDAIYYLANSAVRDDSPEGHSQRPSAQTATFL